MKQLIIDTLSGVVNLTISIGNSEVEDLILSDENADKLLESIKEYPIQGRHTKKTELNKSIKVGRATEELFEIYFINSKESENSNVTQCDLIELDSEDCLILKFS